MLKWVGSKRWHVEQVRALWHGERIVEPFCGSCAITFGLRPKAARLNDANPHLVNFYRWVQSVYQEGWQIPLDSDETLYYIHRDWFNMLVREGNANTSIAAQLFYYLNQHGFNNLCRFNAKGEFNVPFRAGRNAVPPPLDAWRQVLAPYTFTSGDWAGIETEPGDFVYADPPYLGTFGYSSSFDLEEQKKVAATFMAHAGPVVLMNAAHPDLIAYYKQLGYRLTFLAGGQKMSASRGESGKITEIMATNFIV